MNRLPDLTYLLYANAIGQINDNDNSLVNRIYDSQTIDRIMYRQILADIEQNMFRSKIRNIDNEDHVTYTMFFDVKQYRPLIEMMQSRYGKQAHRLI